MIKGETALTVEEQEEFNSLMTEALNKYMENHVAQ